VRGPAGQGRVVRGRGRRGRVGPGRAAAQVTVDGHGRDAPAHTNRGAFGFAFDASTSPKALALIHVQAGTLGSNGDWVDGEVSPIQRVAQTRDSQTDHLKLRPWHRREVNLLDPLTAAPDRNRFLKTVVPFLRAVR